MCRAIIQSILNKLEYKSGRNFFKFCTGQCKFLITQQDRLGTNWLQSNPAKKVLGVPADKKTPM